MAALHYQSLPNQPMTLIEFIVVPVKDKIMSDAIEPKAK